jgi:hypothetical protein
MDERNHSFTTNKARKQQDHQRPKKKKGTDEQAIKASVGQKRDREPLRS